MNTVYFIISILFTSSLGMFLYVSWLNYKAVSRSERENVEKIM